MPLDIQAFLTGQTFAVGEMIPLRLIASNPGPEAISITDPRRGGKYFRLRIKVATGEWRTVTMDEVLSVPGVPPIIGQVQAPVAYKWNFEFDLTALTKMDQPGGYALVVEYEWQPGKIWNSPPIPFRIVMPKSGLLVVMPSEATRTGYHGLVWLHADGGEVRALLLDFRIQEPIPPIQGAVEIARLKANSALTLSMSPAGLPFPDRWVAWVEGERVCFSYWARTEQDRMPSRFFSVGGIQPELIRPVLASRAPDEGRPGCLIGLLLRSATGQQMVSVEVHPDGQFQISQPQGVGGIVRDAWATALSDGLRLFVFACQSDQSLHILSISCAPGQQCQTPMSWFRTEGVFLAGDIRVALDRSVRVGLLLDRGNEWERLTFVSPMPGQLPEPVSTPLKHPPGAAAVRVRLDGKGNLHTLFLSDGALKYVPPLSQTVVGSYQRPVVAGNSADLLISPDGQVVLVYYDFEKGPTFLRV
jgi:hypothetical protein